MVRIIIDFVLLTLVCLQMFYLDNYNELSNICQPKNFKMSGNGALIKVVSIFFFYPGYGKSAFKSFFCEDTTCFVLSVETAREVI